MVEQLAYIQRVYGSIPWVPICRGMAFFNSIISKPGHLVVFRQKQLAIVQKLGNMKYCIDRKTCINYGIMCVLCREKDEYREFCKTYEESKKRVLESRKRGI